MSKKKTNQQVEHAGLSANAKKSIIISVICVVMAIVLAISIVLVVKNASTTDDDSSSSSSSTGSSSLYIKNGDFAYYDEESTSYPKAEDYWTVRKYEIPELSDDEETSHGFETVSDTDEVVYGIVSTDSDEWETVTSDLAEEGVTLGNNPGVHAVSDDTELDKNVYLLASKTATTAAIFSTSFYVSSQESAKITVYLNVSGLQDGSKVSVMAQYYNSSTNLSALEEYRYAYDFEIDNTAETDENGWMKCELYVFNRTTSSKSICLSIGIGNSYTGDEGEGIIYIDDITYETVSANTYRLYAEKETSGTNFHAIESTSASTDEIVYSKFSDGQGNDITPIELTDYLELDDAKVSEESYSPFVSGDAKDADKFQIFSVSNDGTKKDSVALVLDKWKADGTTYSDIIVQSDPDDATDHLHISFWVRLKQNSRVATTKINIVLQTYTDGEWEEMDSGSFTSVETPQNIKDDDNCGWVKYEFYVKPTTSSEVATQIRIVCSLGKTEGYSENANSDYLPDGTIYATSPLVEQITASEYSSASSGTYAKKLNLVGDTGSTSITNGMFSSISTNTPDKPSDWTAVFGGENEIFRDGDNSQVPDDLPQSANDVSAKLVKDSDDAPYYDDSEHNYLEITNNVATSYGFISDEISLSSKTVYAISVLAKVSGDAKPYIYLVQDGAETRQDAILGEFTANASTTADDNIFGLISKTDNGWVRYYIVVVTGDESMTVRLALFNGDIWGEERQQGTVAYDIASLVTLGTYTIDTTEYEEDDDDAPETLRDRITYTAKTGYTVFEELTDTEIAEVKSENDNVTVAEPDWDEMIENAIEEANEEDDDDDDDDDDTTTTTIDWSLLASVITSVAMIAALLIVAVIQIFKRRQK